VFLGEKIMKKILVAVDNTKGSEQAVQALASWVKAFQPESVLLLHIERLYGPSIIGEALESEQDIEEVSAALEGTEYLEKLDAESARIISHFTDRLKEAGYRNVEAVIKKGHPAEQIVNTAKEEGVDLIVMGSRGRRQHSFLLGSVSREVSNTADISVLTVR
jgi:nucleotide-binding universal stress UspA family protein